MNIVERAYFKTLNEWPQNAEIIGFAEAVRKEIERLIEVRGYPASDWPWRHLGPLPDRLRSRNKAGKEGL